MYMQLKYQGKLGFYEARYRLNIGNRDKLLEKISELKKQSVKISQIDIAKKIFT